jgi:hypothetical protein
MPSFASHPAEPRRHFSSHRAKLHYRYRCISCDFFLSAHNATPNRDHHSRLYFWDGTKPRHHLRLTPPSPSAESPSLSFRHVKSRPPLVSHFLKPRRSLFSLVALRTAPSSASLVLLYQNPHRHSYRLSSRLLTAKVALSRRLFISPHRVASPIMSRLTRQRQHLRITLPHRTKSL